MTTEARNGLFSLLFLFALERDQQLINLVKVENSMPTQDKEASTFHSRHLIIDVEFLQTLQLLTDNFYKRLFLASCFWCTKIKKCGVLVAGTVSEGNFKKNIEKKRINIDGRRKPGRKNVWNFLQVFWRFKDFSDHLNVQTSW